MLEQRLLLSADPLASLAGGVDPAAPSAHESRVLDWARYANRDTIVVDVRNHERGHGDDLSQIVYLSFGGANDVTYDGPVTVTGMDVTPFAAGGELRGHEGEIADALVAKLSDAFAGSGVTFTTQAPTEGEYSTVHLGGDGAAFAQWGTYWALSEQVDHGNADHGDDAFIFTDLLPATGLSADAYGDLLAGLVGHEVGHLLGLEHAHQVETGDPLAEVAFKPYTHVEIARDVRDDILEDGKLSIAGHAYNIHPKYLEALQRFPAYYYAGAVGPDGFPDVLMGQGVIHPNDTGTWLARVFDMAWQAQGPDSPYSADEKLQILAWSYGYATHAAGDMFAHTLVNEFAEGVFPAVGDLVTDHQDLANAVRHLMVEAYIGDATPGFDLSPETSLLPDGSTSTDSTPGIPFAAPIRFIHETLIRAFPGDPSAPADTGRTTLAVNAATDTFLRTAGSFVTDGFVVGQEIYGFGFAAAANNGRFIVKAVTATTLQVEQDILASDAGSGDEALVVQGARGPLLGPLLMLQDKVDALALASGPRPTESFAELATQALAILPAVLDNDPNTNPDPAFIAKLTRAYFYNWSDALDAGIRNWGEFGLATTKAMFDADAKRFLETPDGPPGILDIILNELEDPNHDGLTDDGYVNRFLLPMLGVPKELTAIRVVLDAAGDLLAENLVGPLGAILNPVSDALAELTEIPKQFVRDMIKERTGLDVEQFDMLSSLANKMDLKSITVGGTVVSIFKPGDHERLDSFLGIQGISQSESLQQLLTQIPGVAFHEGAKVELDENVEFDKAKFAAYFDAVQIAKMLLLTEDPVDGDTTAAGGLSALMSDVLSDIAGHEVDYDWSLLNNVGNHGGNIMTTTLPRPGVELEVETAGGPTGAFLSDARPWLRLIDGSHMWRDDSLTSLLLPFRVHAGGGTGASAASWEFTGLAAGQYDVQATWLTNITQKVGDHLISPASNATYRILVNGVLVATVAKNQGIFTSEVEDGGLAYDKLATVTLAAGQTLRIELSDIANGDVVAGPIRVASADGTVVRKVALQRNPQTLAVIPTPYAETGSGWVNLGWDEGTGNMPVWESEILRPVFRVLFHDWQNGDLNFPDLGDATSPDPNGNPSIVPDVTAGSYATPFELAAAPPAPSQATPGQQPLLFIPGFAATMPDVSVLSVTEWLRNRGADPSKLVVDPLTNSAGDLLQSLQNVGYRSEAGAEGPQTLYVATWDWRSPVAPRDGTADGVISGVTGASISDNVWESGLDYLGWWLKKVKDDWFASTGQVLDKVDIVTHSTGGLVLRSYLQSTAYGDDLPEVDDVVQVGVPNEGVVITWGMLQDDYNNTSDQSALAHLLSRAYQYVLDGGTIQGANDGADISLATLTGNAEERRRAFIRQYVPSMEDLLLTLPFVDDGITVETRPNVLLADLNFGADPNSFIDVVSGTVTIVYGSGMATANGVVEHTGGGTSTQIQQFTDLLGRPAAPGETWYSNVITSAAGDATVPTASAAGNFLVDAARLASGKLVLHDEGAVLHSPLLTVAASQLHILAGVGVTGATAADLSTNGLLTRDQTVLVAIAQMGLVDPVQLLRQASGSVGTWGNVVIAQSGLDNVLPGTSTSASDLLGLDAYLADLQERIADAAAATPEGSADARLAAMEAELGPEFELTRNGTVVSLVATLPEARSGTVGGQGYTATFTLHLELRIDVATMQGPFVAPASRLDVNLVLNGSPLHFAGGGPVNNGVAGTAVADNKPLLIVHGLSGSLPMDSIAIEDWLLNRGFAPDQLVIDPFGQRYTDLIESLKNAGYRTEADANGPQTLYFANWDMRLAGAPRDGVADGVISGVTASSISDNTFNYELDYLGWWLKKVADDWRASTGQELASVDVVTHSTGGVIARSYIQSTAYGGEYAAGHHLPVIDDLVQLGVPNEGAAVAYALLNGDFNNRTADMALAHTLSRAWDLVLNGATVQGPTPISLATLPADLELAKLEFVRQYMPSLYDLLPTLPFIDAGTGAWLTVPNPVIEDLNAGADPNAFIDLVGTVTIVYSADQPTIDHVVSHVGGGDFDEILGLGELIGRPPGANETWYEPVPTANAGDGTVTTESAVGNFFGDTARILAGKLILSQHDGLNHGHLPNDAGSQQAILAAIGVTGDIAPAIVTGNTASMQESVAFGLQRGLVDPIYMVSQAGGTLERWVEYLAQAEGLQQNVAGLDQSVADVLGLDSFFADLQEDLDWVRDAAGVGATPEARMAAFEQALEARLGAGAEVTLVRNGQYLDFTIEMQKDASGNMPLTYIASLDLVLALRIDVSLDTEPQLLQESQLHVHVDVGAFQLDLGWDAVLPTVVRNGDDVTVTAGAGNDKFILEADPDSNGGLRLRSLASNQFVAFERPLGTLTINLGGGADNLTIGALPAGNVVVVGGAGNDSVTLTAGGHVRDLTVAAEDIVIAEALVLSAEDITLTGEDILVGARAAITASGDFIVNASYTANATWVLNAVGFTNPFDGASIDIGAEASISARDIRLQSSASNSMAAELAVNDASANQELFQHVEGDAVPVSGDAAALFVETESTIDLHSGVRLTAARGGIL